MCLRRGRIASTPPSSCFAASTIFSPVTTRTSHAVGRHAAPPPVSQDVWAVVDGREIRREEVEKAYRRTVQPNAAISEEEEATARLNLLDQVIAQNILLAKGNELKIVLPESELDAAFNDG